MQDFLATGKEQRNIFLCASSSLPQAQKSGSFMAFFSFLSVPIFPHFPAFPDFFPLYSKARELFFSCTYITMPESMRGKWEEASSLSLPDQHTPRGDSDTPHRPNMVGHFTRALRDMTCSLCGVKWSSERPAQQSTHIA